VSIKLHTSVTETFGFISETDSAITLGPKPDIGPNPVRAAGESDDDFRRRVEAWAAPRVEWERPLHVARETGNYTPITSATERPLIFKMRQISMSQRGKMERYLSSLPEDALLERACLIFRFAVVGLDGDVPMLVHDRGMAPAVDKAYPELGPIRPEAFVDLFTGREDVVVEVATHAWKKSPPGN
jgi:hypothetical protein